jgi:hypothetical protein
MPFSVRANILRFNIFTMKFKYLFALIKIWPRQINKPNSCKRAKIRPRFFVSFMNFPLGSKS